MSEPEVTSYRLENAKTTELANIMSVSLTLLHCVLLAEKTADSLTLTLIIANSSNVRDLNRAF